MAMFNSYVKLPEGNHSAGKGNMSLNNVADFCRATDNLEGDRSSALINVRRQWKNNSLDTPPDLLNMHLG